MVQQHMGRTKRFFFLRFVNNCGNSRRAEGSSYENCYYTLIYIYSFKLVDRRAECMTFEYFFNIHTMLRTAMAGGACSSLYENEIVRRYALYTYITRVDEK